MAENHERLLKEAKERWAGLLDGCVHVKSDGTSAFSAQGCYDVCGVCGDAAYRSSAAAVAAAG